MGRSQSFASASTDSSALFGLAFAPAACFKALNLASEEQLVGSLCKRHAVTLPGSDSLQAHGFRFFFTPLLTVLFTFPSRYWSTIGLLVVFSLGGWCRRIQAGFLRSRPTQDLPLQKTILSPTGLSPSTAVLSSTLLLGYSLDLRVLQPRSRRNGSGLGSSAFARHYSRNHYCFLFLCLLRCFSSAGSPPNSRMSGLQPDGLPHSEIRESSLICSYSRLIAACHVLLRLQEPWHPPCALGYFTYTINDITLFARLLSCLLLDISSIS